ncbi:MAG: hypothetical protein IJW60_04755, partial [Clostridia bacterium]|nr:hypothetical protein [Clostridia bacterium]
SENVKVTVRGPDKKVVNDLNGKPINNVSAIENNYEFEIEQTGKYTITYTYSDQSGNENFINYSAFVRENVAPTISVNASRTEIAKLNDVIQIASYTVSDNETSADNLISFTGLLTPNEEMLRLNGDSFKATQKGVWVVYYYCCDEAGNYSVASYEIIVS